MKNATNELTGFASDAAEIEAIIASRQFELELNEAFGPAHQPMGDDELDGLFAKFEAENDALGEMLDAQLERLAVWRDEDDQRTTAA